MAVQAVDSGELDDTMQANEPSDAPCIPQAAVSTSLAADAAAAAAAQDPSESFLTESLSSPSPSISTGTSRPFDDVPAVTGSSNSDALQARPTGDAPCVQPAPPLLTPMTATAAAIVPTSATHTRAHNTRSTTVASAFFSRLSTRAPVCAVYFKQHFLSSSPLCPCKRFPVYASKLGQLTPACKFSAVDHLCLVCVCELLHYGFDTTPSLEEAFWTKEMETEVYDYYYDFAMQDELLEQHLSLEQECAEMERNMERITPWLRKRGVHRTCVHAGACLKLKCIQATVRVTTTAADVLQP